MLFSEPKIPQSRLTSSTTPVCACFSALQRAENSSIFGRTVETLRGLLKVSVLFSEPKIPQFHIVPYHSLSDACFSALQRAENSSIPFRFAHPLRDADVSVLFSEPKIPQFIRRNNNPVDLNKVSVLFSEPKIPQFPLGVVSSLRVDDEFQCSSASRKFLNLSHGAAASDDRAGFSALQRAENSSIVHQSPVACQPPAFQCSSASRKFLNPSSTLCCSGS